MLLKREKTAPIAAAVPSNGQPTIQAQVDAAAAETRALGKRRQDLQATVERNRASIGALADRLVAGDSVAFATAKSLRSEMADQAVELEAVDLVHERAAQRLEDLRARLAVEVEAANRAAALAEVARSEEAMIGAMNELFGAVALAAEAFERFSRGREELLNEKLRWATAERRTWDSVGRAHAAAFNDQLTRLGGGDGWQKLRRLHSEGWALFNHGAL